MSTPKAFLKDHKAAGRRPLNRAVGWSLAAGVLLIAQAWLLADVLASVALFGASLDEVVRPLVALPLLMLARAGALWLADLEALAAARRIKGGMRAELGRRLAGLGPVRLGRPPSAEFGLGLVEGIEALGPYYAGYLPGMALAAVLPLAIIGVVLPIDWISALVLAVTAPLIPLAMILIGKGTERLNQAQWAAMARLGARFLESLQGLTTLKLFAVGRREAALVARLSDDYRKTTMKVLRVAFLSSLALEFLASVSIAVVAVFIGFRLLWGEIDLARGLFVLLLAPEFYLPLRRLGTHYHARLDAVAAAERLLPLFEAPEPEAPPAVPAGARDPRGAHVVFEDAVVDFGDGRRGLDGLSLKVPPGTTLALVGPSGAGKSTAMNLLLGFLAPDGGRVLIDGAPAGDRSHLAWVPQSPYLIRGSLRDNLRLGAPQADDAALLAALEAASAAHLVDLLPGGLDAPLAEHGRDLSGGEMRRVALARALVRQPRLLLLDEPTAGLDAASEQAISAALKARRGTATVILIAHRPQTLRHTLAADDAVAVLEAGRLAALTTAAALDDPAGPLAALFSQAGAA
ncbi:thiol reductant ABC exporter subunit CydD [Roseospirillum parvum]|uniref:ATP-binding cassette, subfamily C, CydD n=1 Tax=Roseospirillum parvum TaxID=83401 RepID=A0A1G7WNM7_9PROT|nr:thiol reductant ABC exporter subunit CydD [Roseospirillum parvum]SDG73513.1 ATP-binding cassette, subfamily C, CydD [Roseospirillum parvum]